jgi:integrase
MFIVLWKKGGNKMNTVYTSKRLLEEFMVERHALGFNYKTGKGAVKRFLSNFTESANGEIEFTKEYVLENTRRKPNQCDNTVLRDVCAVNCFLGFVIRKGFKAYQVPRRSLPKENKNFKAHIFTNDEISRLLIATDSIPFTKQNPIRHHQLPVMFRILLNCGLRISELLNLRVCDVDLNENVFTILETKFHKNRLVPFSDAVSEALKDYFTKVTPLSKDAWLFCSPKPCGKYTNSGLHAHFQLILRLAGIPRGGYGKGPRPHDIRHTFAVHCLNNWVLSGVDIMSALPVLSRYLGHNGIKGTQKYLQLTAQMYPDIVTKLESKYGNLIPVAEVAHETV